LTGEKSLKSKKILSRLWAFLYWEKYFGKCLLCKTHSNPANRKPFKLQTIQTRQAFQTSQTSQTFQTLQTHHASFCYPAEQVM